MWPQHYDIQTDIHTDRQTYIHTDRQTEPKYDIEIIKPTTQIQFIFIT